MTSKIHHICTDLHRIRPECNIGMLEYLDCSLSQKLGHFSRRNVNLFSQIFRLLRLKMSSPAKSRQMKLQNCQTAHNRHAGTHPLFGQADQAISKGSANSFPFIHISGMASSPNAACLKCEYKHKISTV